MEFDSEIYNFSRNRNHVPSHMMILVVLSHGRDGHIYAADGRVISTESIYEKFNNQFCPLLKGKPKFFIIQVKYFASETNLFLHRCFLEKVFFFFQLYQKNSLHSVNSD